MTANRRHILTLSVATTAIALTLASRGLAPHPLLVWNETASLPIGLYRTLPMGNIRVGDLVLTRPPAALAQLFADRDYLPLGVPLLKRVAALSGATICVRNGTVSIDGGAIARTLSQDSLGRPLPSWSGCRTLGSGEIFLLNIEIPTSLDGRYFGPTPRADVIGRAQPLWTFRAR